MTMASATSAKLAFAFCMSGPRAPRPAGMRRGVYTSLYIPSKQAFTPPRLRHACELVHYTAGRDGHVLRKRRQHLKLALKHRMLLYVFTGRSESVNVPASPKLLLETPLPFMRPKSSMQLSCFFGSDKPSLRAMVTSFKRKDSIVEITSRPQTPYHTKPREVEVCRPPTRSSRPNSDGHRRCDSAVEINQKNFEQNQSLNYNHDVDCPENQKRRSSVYSVSVAHDEVPRQPLPRRPDTPATFAFPTLGSQSSTSSSPRKKNHDRTSKDTDMVSPLRLQDQYANIISSHPHEFDSTSTLPQHKTACTRMLPSRHQVSMRSPDARIQPEKKAVVVISDRGKLIGDLEATTRELGEEQTRLRKAQQDVDSLKQQLVIREQYTRDLQIDNVNKKKGMDKALNMYHEVASELKELKAMCTKSPFSISKYQWKVNVDLRDEISSLKVKCTRAMADASDFETRFKNAQSDVSKSNAGLRNCGDQLRREKAVTRSQEQQLKALQEEKRGLERDLGLKKDELKNVKATVRNSLIQDFDIRLAHEKASHSRTSSELDASLARERAMDSRLIQEKASHDRTSSELDAAEEEIDRLEQRLEQYRASDMVVRGELKTVRESLSFTTSHNADLSLENTVLRHRSGIDGKGSGVRLTI